MSITPSSRLDRKLWFLLGLTVVIGLGLRMTSPSDLVEKTQHKTIAYTVDIVENGRWILPRSDAGEPATKPLLYNWLDVPVYLIVGEWYEWVMKLPSVLAGLFTLWLCIFMTRWMLTDRSDRAPEPGSFHAETDSSSLPGPASVGVVSGILLLAGYPLFKQIYIARPEMISMALVCASWVSASLLLSRAASGKRGSAIFLLALGFWLSVSLAAIAKGPPAALGLIYLVLASKLIYGRWALLNQTGWWWGVPLSVMPIGAWIGAAYVVDPVHVRAVLLGDELVDRVVEGGTLQILAEFWHMPGYFVARYLPWSIFAVAVLFVVPFRRWMKHPLAPAILWVFIVVIFFSCSTGKIPRYISPAYSAGAAMAAWFLLRGPHPYRIRPIPLAVAGLFVTIGLGVYWWTLSTAAENQFGEHNLAFAREVRSRVGPDEPIVFLQDRSEIIATLLNRVQPDWADPELIKSGVWFIDNADRVDEPIVVSEPVNKRGEGRIALDRAP